MCFTVRVLDLPGDVCVCDTFQGSCQRVVWQSPSMIPVGRLSGVQKPAAGQTQEEDLPHELFIQQH